MVSYSGMGRKSFFSVVKSLWTERPQRDGGKIMRVRITLACTECKQRNYNVTKEKKNHPERMETKKYCRFCRKHTMHKETK